MIESLTVLLICQLAGEAVVGYAEWRRAPADL